MLSTKTMKKAFPFATLNDREIVAVNALIAYVAHTQALGESLVREMLASAFGVESVEALPSHQYDDVVRHLVDSDFKALVH